MLDYLPPILERALIAVGGQSLYQPGHPRSLVGRSSKWPTVQKHFLRDNPVCVVSGLIHKKSVVQFDVHHVKPFHEHPELELDVTNLRTVARPYHFLVGHLCDWHAHNDTFDADAAEWRRRISTRRRCVWFFGKY